MERLQKKMQRLANSVKMVRAFYMLGCASDQLELNCAHEGAKERIHG